MRPNAFLTGNRIDFTVDITHDTTPILRSAWQFSMCISAGMNSAFRELTDRLSRGSGTQLPRNVSVIC